MKRNYFFTLALVLIAAACGGGNSPNNKMMPAQTDFSDPGDPSATTSSRTADRPNSSLPAAPDGTPQRAIPRFKTDPANQTGRILTPRSALETNTKGQTQNQNTETSTNPCQLPAGMIPLIGIGGGANGETKEDLAKKLIYYDETVAATKIKQAKDILAQYPSGQLYLAELNGKNPFNTPIEIKLTSCLQLNLLSGVTGGTIVAQKAGATYIIANGETAASDLAHIIAHESQHITDDSDEDAYLAAHLPLKDKIEKEALKIKISGLASLSADEKKDLDFITNGVLCTEARAYTRNLNLSKEGLAYNYTPLKTMTLGQIITENYLSKNGLSVPGNPDLLVKQCLEKSKVTDFQQMMIDQANQIK